VTEPRRDAAGWNNLLSDSTSLEQAAGLSSMNHNGNLDASRRQRQHLDVFTGGDSFGDRFAIRQQPKFSDESQMMKPFGQRLVDGSMAQPGYSAGYGWSGRTPWSLGKRSAAAAGWKRSLASNDVSLDAAISKVKELMARRQLLKKWLMQVL